MNFLELLDPKYMTKMWDAEAEEQKYLGNALFPRLKTGQLTLRHFRGKSGLPVVLEPSTYDAKPNIRGRQGVSLYQSDMPFFRESMRIGEKEIMEIHQALQSQDLDTARFILSRVYDDVGTLRRAANARVEMMIWELMQTGGITATASTEHGRTTVHELNFDPDGSWATSNVTTLLTDGMWSAPTTATPVADIMEVLREASTKGIVLKKLIMNSVTLNNMLATAEVRALLNPQALFMVDTEYLEALQRKLNISIVVYDALYGYVGGSAKFVLDGNVIFIPDGAMGEFIFGATPEEIGVIQSPHSQKQLVDTGITIVKYEESSSVVNHFVNVSFLGLPNFKNMDAVYILQTLGA